MFLNIQFVYNKKNMDLLVCVRFPDEKLYVLHMLINKTIHQVPIIGSVLDTNCDFFEV